MQVGEQIQLTDGKGNVLVTKIIAADKKKCIVKIFSKFIEPQSPVKSTIAISLIKNSSRFEWFLEKATEIGVSNIIPLICERTEKQHFRFDRMKNILVSAMLQSKQAWLPVLNEPLKFKELIQSGAYNQKYIAHCEEGKKTNFLNSLYADKENISKVLPLGENLGGALIVIGPEGDFTQDEINQALQNDFIPISLGKNRLRTETAGIVACTLLNSV